MFFFECIPFLFPLWEGHSNFLAVLNPSSMFVSCTSPALMEGLINGLIHA